MCREKKYKINSNGMIFLVRRCRMEHVDMILVGIGLSALLLSLIVLMGKLVKDNGKTSRWLPLLLIMGFLSIGVGVSLMIPGIKKPLLDMVSNEEVPPADSGSTKSGESSESIETPQSNENEMQKIARNLVEQEMGKQVGLSEWEITRNEMTSDQEVYNIADYDKPEGEMRKVWISGNVRATSSDGVTGNVGYELELYQMNHDEKWYIGNHWGVLIDLDEPDKPVVENEGEDRAKHLGSSNPMGEEKSVESPNTVSQEDIKGAWHWRESDDFYMILRDNGTYSYIEKNAGFVSEGNYTVDGHGNPFKVSVHYSTGERDSVMMIDLIDNNHIEGSEDGLNWKAERVDLSEAERMLNSF
jgi:hypothetical protein